MSAGPDAVYLSHWDLADCPFSGRFEPKCFYQSPVHEEALARLHFLVEHRRRLGLLLGESGTGKSFLLRMFADRLRRTGQPVAAVGLLGLEPDEMMWLVAARLGLNLPRGLPAPAVWPAVTDRLAEYRYQELQTVLLLDDADRAAAAVLALAVRLVKSDLSAESRLTVVLAGREQQIGRLGRDLLELAELRIDLARWEPRDTEQYVQVSLAQAGRTAAAFDPSALVRLHELGGGVPRRVAQLADLSLVAGAGQNLNQIDADTVESVSQELGVTGEG
jgi:type II secretory pathway predicted ATPase ExeA